MKTNGIDKKCKIKKKPENEDIPRLDKRDLSLRRKKSYTKDT